MLSLLIALQASLAGITPMPPADMGIQSAHPTGPAAVQPERAVEAPYADVMTPLPESIDLCLSGPCARV